MNNFPSKDIVDRLKAEYPEGTRIALVHMDDPYSKLKPGDRGTVKSVDDAGTVHVSWDSGSGLGLVYGEDSFRKLNAAELSQEKLLAERPSIKQKLADNKAAIDKTTPKNKNKELEL